MPSVGTLSPNKSPLEGVDLQECQCFCCQSSFSGSWAPSPIQPCPESARPSTIDAEWGRPVPGHPKEKRSPFPHGCDPGTPLLPLPSSCLSDLPIRGSFPPDLPVGNVNTHSIRMNQLSLPERRMALPQLLCCQGRPALASLPTQRWTEPSVGFFPVKNPS